MNLIDKASERGVFLCTVESLTAGLVASEIAKTPGASKAFLGGIVSYTDASKIGLLGLSQDLLKHRTAVSQEVAKSMSVAASKIFAEANNLPAQKLIAIATTGVAGPDQVGENPVGRVYISITSKLGTRCETHHFEGSRSEISNSTVAAALAMLWEELKGI